ncbi:MAG: glycosyltransferase family 1 protein [Steroidobacteraceae bacterium]
MRILIATDAWLPQTNGVVSTLKQTVAHLQRRGHEVELLTSEQFSTFACPGYGEIRLAVGVQAGVLRQFDRFLPEAVHIATEGPIGLAVRSFCRKHGLRFTTSYHTKFPQYLRQRLPVPVSFSYALLRWFHRAGERCMVSTPSMQNELEGRGFRNIVRWRRGVDADLFQPRDKTWLALPRPVAVYVGRLAVEKNLDAFLGMTWHGSKLVVGDGPERARLEQQYPQAHFVGYRHGEDLARHVAAADVMVFPSLTDTFGLVNLEAMACGVPVAAYPVTGPVDVIEDGVTGALDRDLATAAARALRSSPSACREWAKRYSWASCTAEFEAHLAPSGL